jgi:hypothetical protein
VRDVIKMLKSGVSEDVVKAYIQNSPSTFNLTADDIIQLQGAGVAPSTTTAMLNHDAALRQNGSVPPAPPDQPALPPPDQSQGATTAPAYPPTTADYGDAAAYYNTLAPYGDWSYLPDYGYCWQPYGTFWALYPTWGYPWGWLDTGWWFCAGRGWCWFPRFHDRGFGPGHNHGYGFPGRQAQNVGIRAGARNGIAGHAGYPFTTPSGNLSGGGNRGIGNPPVRGNHGFGGTGSIVGRDRFQTFGRAPTVRQTMAMNRPMGGGVHGFSGPGRTGYSGGGFSGGVARHR